MVLVETERGRAVLGRSLADSLAERTDLGAAGGEVGLEGDELQPTTAGELGREVGGLMAGFLMIIGGSDSSLVVLQRFFGLYL